MTSEDNKSGRAGDIARKTKESLVWYTSIPFMVHIIRFVNSILLARILSPSDFGVIGIVTVILYYCDSYTDFGFGKAIIQRSEISKGHFVSYFSFNILVSAALFIIMQLFSHEFESFFDIEDLADAISMYSYLFLITACAAGPRIKLKRQLRYKILAISEGVKISISMPISLLLAIDGHGFWSIIYATLISNTVVMLMLMHYSRVLPVFNLKLGYLKDLYTFGIWDFVGSQFGLISQIADKLIIGKLLGASALGFYDKGLGLARMPNDQITSRVGQISFSSFSRIRDDKDELERYFFKMTSLCTVILVPILFGLIWVAELFVLVLLGEKWLPIVPVLKIFALSYVFISLTSSINSLNLAVGKVKQQTILNILGAGILIAGLLYAAPYGIEYAALVILGKNILMFFASYLIMSTYVGFSFIKYISNVMPAFLMVSIMLALLFIFDANVEIPENWLVLALSIVIGAVVYFAALMLIPFKNMRFLRNRVINKLSNAINR